MGVFLRKMCESPKGGSPWSPVASQCSVTLFTFSAPFTAALPLSQNLCFLPSPVSSVHGSPFPYLPFSTFLGSSGPHFSLGARDSVPEYWMLHHAHMWPVFCPASACDQNYLVRALQRAEQDLRTEVTEVTPMNCSVPQSCLSLVHLCSCLSLLLSSFPSMSLTKNWALKQKASLPRC